MAKFSISGYDEWNEALGDVFQQVQGERIRHALEMSGKIYVAAKYTLEINSDGNIVETTIYKQEE